MVVAILLIWCSLGVSFCHQRNSFKLTGFLCGKKMYEGMESHSSMHFLDDFKKQGAVLSKDEMFIPK